MSYAVTILDAERGILIGHGRAMRTVYVTIVSFSRYRRFKMGFSTR